MRMETTEQGGIPVLKLTGRFDAYETSQVKSWIDDTITAEQPNAAVDLANVTFIDSSALAMLVRGMKNCREQGGDLHLAQLHQAVQIIFELTGLNRAFKIYPTLDEAVEAFSS